jgi:hypothetical protein
LYDLGIQDKVRPLMSLAEEMEFSQHFDLLNRAMETQWP